MEVKYHDGIAMVVARSQYMYILLRSYGIGEARKVYDTLNDYPSNCEENSFVFI